MNEIFALIDKIPLSIVVHDNANIIYSNVIFNNIASIKENATSFDFITWLKSVIKNQEHIQVLIDAFQNNTEVNLETEAYLGGVQRHWKITSFPFLIDKSNKSNRITCLKDSGASQGVKPYWDLHLRVNKATMELLKEITQRKKMEEKADKLNQQLILASRQAGMAEVAASMLHNVGNILNSVGVSLGLLRAIVDDSLFTKIQLTHELLKDHKMNLIEYFQNDKKGKLIPGYLILLFEKIVENNDHIKNETNNLLKSYEYIKDIISSQSEIATHPTIVIEEVQISEMIDLALNMAITKNTLILNKIKIIKEYNYASHIKTDRSYLLQILINLLKNAKEALQESTNNAKKITIQSDISQASSHIVITISDNGIGIPSEDIKRIFGLGFTTKNKGHGFGLHNCALMAKELGGSITANSQGIDQGSQFLLKLPIAYNQLEVNDD